MRYQGKVQNGVIVLESGARLPEGTAVTVEPVEKKAAATAEDPLYRLADLAGPTGLRDLAMNIDHYLYGHPKASDGEQ